jgi:hypothetical protein
MKKGKIKGELITSLLFRQGFSGKQSLSERGLLTMVKSLFWILLVSILLLPVLFVVWLVYLAAKNRKLFHKVLFGLMIAFTALFVIDLRNARIVAERKRVLSQAFAPGKTVDFVTSELDKRREELHVTHWVMGHNYGPPARDLMRVRVNVPMSFIGRSIRLDGFYMKAEYDPGKNILMTGFTD